jgi:hypothetical protein
MVDHALSLKIKEAYGNVEKGMRGYKVTSIDSGAVRLACQMIAGKLVRKNKPTQVYGFIDARPLVIAHREIPTCETLK